MRTIDLYEYYDMNGNFISYLRPYTANKFLNNAKDVKIDGNKIYRLSPLNKQVYYRSRERRTYRCVVCNSSKNLSQHHVVPRVVLKHMDLNIKNLMCSDFLVIVCGDCNCKAEALLKDFHRSYHQPSSNFYKNHTLKLRLYRKYIKRSSTPNKKLLKKINKHNK